VRTVDAPLRHGFLATAWHGAPIAVVWVKPVVDIAPEIARTVKPWTYADEGASSKPLRPVVTSGGTGIRSNVIVSVGAIRGFSDADADADPAYASRELDSDDTSEPYKHECAHGVLLISEAPQVAVATDVPAVDTSRIA
jgi:hypothetical protein